MSIVRWSQLFIPTLKEDPQEAEIQSHKLMLRAGLIRKLSAGLYTFLPLGRKVLRKVEDIIREEMDRAGALEVLMPALQPKEIWEKTGRFEVLREVMFSMQDRQDRTMVLGPTHEEVITHLVGKEIRSYRDLPKNFYQIQNKFRDEIRPRFGLMRAKEFIMKDAYSFDVDQESSEQSYQSMYEAYKTIFSRCGLGTKIVEADSGAMGGESSHEFMVLADSGEDGLVECSDCDYAANLERAQNRLELADPCSNESPALEEVDTPHKTSITEVSEFLSCKPSKLIKTLIYLVDGKPTAFLLPGVRELNEIKLRQCLNAKEVVLAKEHIVKEVARAPVGYIGPVDLNLNVYADKSLEGSSDLICGANKVHTHYLHLDLKRDVPVTSYIDICFVNDGDGCPRCDGSLITRRGIEVGHVFNLGTKYTSLLNVQFLTKEGKQAYPIMGCYGIGVTRTVQAIIEQSHDEHGIIWPLSVAPYQVELLPLNMQDKMVVQTADSLLALLQKESIDVLYDDRDERAGVKFKDSDLLGIPIRVSIGERSLSKGLVEVKLRKEKEVHQLPVAEIVTFIKNLF